MELKGTVVGNRWFPENGLNLPPRTALREGKFRVYAKGKDHAGNVSGAGVVLFSRTPPDATVPDIAFLPLRVMETYAEHNMPTITGIC